MRRVPLVPHKLLDTLIDTMGLKNDAALARRLELAPPVISKLRSRVLPLGPTHLIRMHEETELPIKRLRELAAA